MSPKNSNDEKAIKTIVVADEDGALRAQIATLLKSDSCTVEEYESSEKLLDSNVLARAHCVIVGVEPTYIETRKVMNAIKQENDQLPIVAIGNDGGVAQAVISIRAGADDYLCKPINSGKIRTMVHRLISG